VAGAIWTAAVGPGLGAGAVVTSGAVVVLVSVLEVSVATTRPVSSGVDLGLVARSPNRMPPVPAAKATAPAMAIVAILCRVGLIGFSLVGARAACGFEGTSVPAGDAASWHSGRLQAASACRGGTVRTVSGCGVGAAAGAACCASGSPLDLMCTNCARARFPHPA
jgi:hypothetical protein